MTELRLARSAVLFVALTASPALAEEYGNSSLIGRQVFSIAVDASDDPVPTRHSRIMDPILGQAATWFHPAIRGALTFDGEGHFVGFRLVWDTSYEATVTMDDPDLAISDHRLTPLKQQLEGTYSVSPDGIVSLTYRVSPARLLGQVSMFQVGTQTMNETETATAVMTSDGRLFGQFAVETSHVYAPTEPGAPSTGWTAVHHLPFETEGLMPSPPTADAEPPTTRRLRGRR